MELINNATKTLKDDLSVEIKLSLDENLTLHTEQENLKKQIEKPEKQAGAEKQPKKKFELVQRVKVLKKLIKELNGSEE